MPGPLSRLLAEDHARLDGLLQRAVADAEEINHATYAAFRAGLLRHISLEEKVLLPAAQQWHGGKARQNFVYASAEFSRLGGAV